MSHVLVIAPHPDDELLGCGGTLLRHLAEGDEVHWLIATAMHKSDGFSTESIAQRADQIERVHQAMGFSARHELGLPTTRLDTLPLGDLVSAIGNVVETVQPDTLYLPYGGDVHSDHGVVFAAARGCSKWFRYPSVRRVYVYETPSETDFALPPDGPGISIQRYVDIGAHLEKKLDVLSLYSSELGDFPFPRSIEAVTALAKIRGAAAGCLAAEGFQVLKEIY
jgi:LmbE family N-acetylglucosaminyl deacetylase